MTLNPKQFPERPTFAPVDDAGQTMDLSGVRAHFEAIRARAGEGQPIGRREATVGTEPAPAPPGFYRFHYGDNAVRRRHPVNSEYEYHSGPMPPRTHLQAVVVHTPPRAQYYYPRQELDQFGPTAAENDYLEAEDRGEPKLFGVDERPGRSVVDSLFGTQKGRAHVGTLLGIAARDTAIRFGGRQLQPPDDLSPHSSRLVRGLKGRGLVDEAAPHAVTNDYTFYDEPEYTMMAEDARIPDDEVKAGRSMLRATLRGDRPRKPRETYTQERLF